MTSYVEDNTSQGKNWIFDSSSTIHVCSQKELFNSLAAKDEGTIKIVEAQLARTLTLGRQGYRKRWMCVL